MTTSIAQLTRDPAGDASRQAFEDAAWAEYLKARAQGPVDGDVDGEPTREGLFWRKPSGAYGVKQWNAGWWAWRAVLTLPMFVPLEPR